MTRAKVVERNMFLLHTSIPGFMAITIIVLLKNRFRYKLLVVERTPGLSIRQVVKCG